MADTTGAEILLVEDNPTDAELRIRTLIKHNLANKLVWVKDGAEALDFIFGTGPYAGRPIAAKPKLMLLDLQLPKVDGIEGSEACQGRRADEDDPDRRRDVLEGGVLSDLMIPRAVTASGSWRRRPT